MDRFRFFVILSVCISSTYSFEKVKAYVCPGIENKCSIKNVTIEPCAEAKNDKPCIVRVGTKAKLNVDFVPYFNATKLKGGLFWANGVLELPLLGQDTNICHATKCPLEENQPFVVETAAQILNIFPPMKYRVKFTMADEDDEGKVCCFEFDIQVKRAKKEE